MLDFGDKDMKSTKKIVANLSRTLKILLDNGEATSIEEAQQLLEGYRLQVHVGSDIAHSSTLQAILLTVINTGRRCFLGGVEVIGCPEANLLISWRNCRSLKEAIIDLQGKVSEKVSKNIPQIFIGNTNSDIFVSEFAVRATFNGWIGGITPVSDEIRLNEELEFSPAGVLAGAIAVSEAFQYVRGSNANAGFRDMGLSLWKPDSAISWLEDKEIGIQIDLLPSKLWLIGLGHLGQSFLWTLGFLPYLSPNEVTLFLQDFDTLEFANDSTSPLTNKEIIGKKKTRAMAEWCEERGFNSIINELLFTGNFKVGSDEPRIALCGVDNSLARSALEDVGFSQIIEVGLGKGTEEYLAFQMHSFPAKKTAKQIWKNNSSLTNPSSTKDKPAYQALINEGYDVCGLTTLAKRSVGASFVGTFTSTLVIAELLRSLLGEVRYNVIDGTLRSFEEYTYIINQQESSSLNLGFTNSK